MVRGRQAYPRRPRGRAPKSPPPAPSAPDAPIVPSRSGDHPERTATALIPRGARRRAYEPSWETLESSRRPVDPRSSSTAATGSALLSPRRRTRPDPFRGRANSGRFPGDWRSAAPGAARRRKTYRFSISSTQRHAPHRPRLRPTTYELQLKLTQRCSATRHRLNRARSDLAQQPARQPSRVRNTLGSSSSTPPQLLPLVHRSARSHPADLLEKTTWRRNDPVLRSSRPRRLAHPFVAGQDVREAQRAGAGRAKSRRRGPVRPAKRLINDPDFPASGPCHPPA